MLAATDQGKHLPVTSILEATKVLVLSLGEGSKEKIADCFAKSGFSEDVCSEDGDPCYQLQNDPFYQFNNDKKALPCLSI